jgi:hypothetical protein
LQADAEGLRQVNDEEIERLCSEFNFNAWTEMSVKDNQMVDDSMKWVANLGRERNALFLIETPKKKNN